MHQDCKPTPENLLCICSVSGSGRLLLALSVQILVVSCAIVYAMGGLDWVFWCVSEIFLVISGAFGLYIAWFWLLNNVRPLGAEW